MNMPSLSSSTASIDAVRGPRRGPQPTAEPVDGLVVEGVDRRLGDAHRPRQPRVGRDPHAVRLDAPAGRLAMLDRAVREVAEVLVQAAAARDVDGLAAAADAEHRHPARVGELGQRELVGVEVRLRRPERRVADRLAVAVGVDVGAARQADPAEAVEQRRDRVVAERRQHHRQPAGELDRAHVDHPERHLALRRIALGDGVGLRRQADLRGRHADQRTAHPAQHPRVLRPAVLGRVDHQRALVEGDAGEAARGDARLAVAAEEDVGAQVDVARGELAVDDGRVGGEHHHALRHEGRRALEHRLAHRLDVPRLGVREDRDALPAVAAARLDDELVEHVQGALEYLGPAEVEGLHRGQQRLLIQVEANHVLDIRVRQLVVGDPGAERVDDRDAGRCAPDRAAAGRPAVSSRSALVRR